MDGGTKQDGTAKLGLGGRGEERGWRGSKPLPLVSSPNREGRRGGAPHPGPSATSTVLVGPFTSLPLPAPGSHYSVRGSETFNPHLLPLNWCQPGCYVLGNNNAQGRP